MKMTSTFKFTACAVALALTSAETTLMAAANQPAATEAPPAASNETAPIAPVANATDVPTDIVASPPTNGSSIPANSDAPGSLVASSAYANLQKDYNDAIEAHKGEIEQWASKFVQEHKELITDGMAMVQKLQAESAALMADAGNSTAAQEKETVQKLRGAVQEQVQQYFSNPEHEQQLDAIREEIKALVAKHIPDVKAWVAEHKADVLAYLAKATEEVETGSFTPICDITEPACMEQMGITQPDAMAYMKEHGAEVQANMEKVEAARNAFIKAHQHQILKMLGAVTKMVETGDYHLPDGVKDALLNKWQNMKEDGDAGTDADTDADADADADADGDADADADADTDDADADDKTSYAAQTQRRTLRGRM